jgi:hypothetical protein
MKHSAKNVRLRNLMGLQDYLGLVLVTRGLGFSGVPLPGLVPGWVRLV